MKSFTISKFMPISFLAALLALVAFFPATPSADPMHPLPPLPPDTSMSAAEAPMVDVAVASAQVEKELHPELQKPVRLIIPSIKLDSPVEGVGVNAAGEMAVPNGNTKTVGWYEYGTIPGTAGSAVMDAHVFAAFSKLTALKARSDIYVQNKKGEQVHFRVMSAKKYPLSGVPMEAIFNDTSGTYLNLITCAGKFNRASGTYSHRLVIYAELVQ